MHARARSTHESGRSVLALVLAAALLVVAVVIVLVYSNRGNATRPPIHPLEHGGGSTSTTTPTDGTRTSVPDPITPHNTGTDTHASTTTPAAGDAWRVAGRVRAHGAVPLADAEVRVEMKVAGETRALGETRTAADGTYEVVAPALGELDPLSASLCEISASVEAPHHAPGRALATFDAHAGDHTVRLDVRVEPGERLTGRIVDAHAKPVADASVRLSVASAKGGVAGFVLVQEVQSGTNGRFDLGFLSAARYHLSARADGIGTAFVDALDLGADAPRDLGDVALAGGDPIAGTVTHTGGEPAAFFEIWAFDADFAAQPDAMSLVVRRAPDVERADGLTVTRTWTDASGRFELKGLRPGQYVLRSPDTRAVLEPHQARFEPGVKDLDVQLQSSSIVVHVRDEDGRPVRGANVRLTELSTLPDGTHEAAGSRVVTARGTDASAVFCADPEAPYAIDAYTQSRRSAEVFVTLSQNEFVHDVDVLLPRKQAMGRIQLDVQGEDGRPLEHLQVELHTSVTRARREDVGLIESDEHGLLPPVPCGTYDLFVGYAPGTDRDHFPVRTQQPVTVAAGDPARVSLRPHRGARVRVTLEVDGPTPPGMAADSSSGSRPLTDDDRRTRFGVSIVVSRTDGIAGKNLQFRLEGGAERGGKGALESRLLPGETATCLEIVEPGEVTLSISGSTAWKSAPVPVALVAGETTPVSLRVRAR